MILKCWASQELRLRPDLHGTNLEDRGPVPIIYNGAIPSLLKDHLVSLKEVFLFVRADVFKRFCDLSRSQLITNNSLCSPMVLKNFLADAVTGSAASSFT